MRKGLFLFALIVLSSGAWSLSSLSGTVPIRQETHDGTRPLAVPTTAMERMLSEAPLRSDLWLALAAARGALSPPAAEESALEMAYLVGGEKVEDIPLRLAYALRSPVFERPTIRDFVKSDVEIIIRRVPSLSPVLAAVDHDALPENRARFEAMVHDVAPDFALRHAEP